MLEQNLRTLKGFLNKYLKKGYIKELKSLVKSLVLFTFKVNKIKRLYINYQKLNNIIIKIKYILLLIKEI